MHALFLAGLLLLSGEHLVQSGAPQGSGAAAPRAQPSVEELMSMGTSLLDRQRYDEAIESFNRVLLRIPDFGPALANRALAYTWTNRLDLATRDLDAAASAMSDTALVHRVRGFIALRRSDDVTAEAEFSRSLDLEPGHYDALRSRAWIFQRARNHVAALADADRYIDSRPNEPRGYVLRATLLIGQRERSLAEAEAGRLIRLFSHDAVSLASAAQVYDELADRARALAAIDQAITLSPDESYYRELRADFRRWDDFAGRRADLVSALALDPGNNAIITELGLVDFRERKWSDAQARFSTVLAMEPRDFGVLAYRAITRLNAGQPSLAARDFRTAVDAAAGGDDFSLICVVFAREGLALQWGMSACDRAVALNPNESRYRADRGLMALRLGRLDAALADYNAAIEADPRRAHGYYGRALVFHRRGEHEASAADRAEALAIDPGIAEDYQKYGFTDF